MCSWRPAPTTWQQLQLQPAASNICCVSSCVQSKEPESTLKRFESWFDGVTFKKGTEVGFASHLKGQLVAQIDGKQVGSAGLCRSLAVLLLAIQPPVNKLCNIQLSLTCSVMTQMTAAPPAFYHWVGFMQWPTCPSSVLVCSLTPCNMKGASPLSCINVLTSHLQVGSINSPALVKALFDIYVGPDPVSVEAKKSIGKGLELLLNE